MGGQLDGNFLPGSLPHKFVLIVTSIICFVVNKFFLSLFSLHKTGSNVATCRNAASGELNHGHSQRAQKIW